MLRDARNLFQTVSLIAKELERDIPVTQVLVFLRIAAAGRCGIDQGELANELGIPSATMSRTIQALSKVHWTKNKAGFDIVERDMSAVDNRRRCIRINTNGEALMARLQPAA
jgi:DNA-binding MarR family transcriptional regulator